ncbi:Vacuolar sorting protein 39 [Zea mays]|uniref:Vacuolar sorting protein 39 n=1 Tax=Zea mays TaxID=4577 RepID=A0A1D6M2Q9_MAIZE|nr:Vacuolar sorting protein 39 [Zea mays]
MWCKILSPSSLMTHITNGGREFVEVKEFGVPDILKSMAWCGDNICLRIKREYMIINSMTGTLTEVFSSGRIAPPLVVPLPTGELILGKFQLVLYSTEKALGPEPEPEPDDDGAGPRPLTLQNESPALKLIREVATLELEIKHLEHYLLALYRKVFEQQQAPTTALPPSDDR